MTDDGVDREGGSLSNWAEWRAYARSHYFGKRSESLRWSYLPRRCEECGDRARWLIHGSPLCGPCFGLFMQGIIRNTVTMLEDFKAELDRSS